MVVLPQPGGPHKMNELIFPDFTILPKGESCVKILSNAGKFAMTLGEPYIFSCHSNLDHIIFPLANNNTLLGSILVGPFLMHTPDSLLLSDIADKYSLPTLETLEMYDEAASLPIVEPSPKP